MAVAELQLTEIRASSDDVRLLETFYHSLYVLEFPDPDERESLENMRGQLDASAASPVGSDRYHIIVAVLDDQLVGAVFFNYLAQPHAGVLEFLFVAPSARQRGIGRQLLDAAERTLAADCVGVGGRLAGIVAEINDPFVRSGPDVMDPVSRALVWSSWGFALLEAPYVQPALSSTQRPVHCLVLIVKSLRPEWDAFVPPSWIEAVVRNYFMWAMRIEAPERNPEFRALRAWLATVDRVSLSCLRGYVGQDAERPLLVEAVRGRGPSFDGVVSLLREAVPGAGRVATDQDFEAAMAATDSGVTYHLWALRAREGEPIEGLASFFSLPQTGFAGYIVLSGRLRGRRLLAQLVARIELQMLADPSSSRGWFGECISASAEAFQRVGFRAVAGDYRPPAVGDVQPQADPERLELLYKEFGRGRGMPDQDELRAAVASILSHIYHVARPLEHPCLVQLFES